MRHRYVRMFVRELKQSHRQMTTWKGFLCGSDGVAKRNWRDALKRDQRIQEALLIRVRGGREEIAVSISYC